MRDAHQLQYVTIAADQMMMMIIINVTIEYYENRSVQNRKRSLNQITLIYHEFTKKEKF